VSLGKGEAMSSAARAAGEGKALSRLSFQLQELVFRKDFREGVTDIKFSPLDDKLAAGRCVTCSFSFCSSSLSLSLSLSLDHFLPISAYPYNSLGTKSQQ
jgi:hypothetical protein